MEPTRAEFLHIDPWQQKLFYALIVLSVGIMAYQVVLRVRLWYKGKPIDWKPDRIGSVLKYVVGQRKVQTSRKKSGAPMHLMIFYGFLALLVATTLLAINTYGPIKFHKGLYYLIYEMTFDILGMVFVVGVGWALIRRWRFKPRSATHDANDYWALALLFVLGFTGYVLEAARMANDPKPFDWSAPVGKAMASVMGPVSANVYVGIWWFHAAWVFIFFAVIPRMRLKHIVMAIFSSAGAPTERPYGQLQPIRIEQVEETGQIGVALPKDYSRWHLMSLDACMECGRCTEVCPAWKVGKVLNPKHIVQDILKANPVDQYVPEATTEEALWECTTCNACVEACPVLIRHVDLIVDARRNLVAEGKLSGPAATMLRQTASSGNAWGAPSSSREDWMKGLDVPLARDGKQFEVLFWVGCAGATDPGAIRTTRATAELLNQAGVNYACLGKEEACTGDPARRVGDEFLYQEMAQKNIDVLGKYGVKKIVTPCPHCFNTFKNESGQFGGDYEVLHHSQLLSGLIEEGKLRSAGPARGEVTFHDPCYLSRINGESDAPRAALGDETNLNDQSVPWVHYLQSEPDTKRNLVEPPHHGRKTLCCGAGGGRMFMDEPADKRPSNRRAAELVDTGASTIALACPFCRIMLDSSLKQVTDRDINLVDMAELLRDANTGGAQE